MKALICLISILMSSELFAFSYSDKVPGKNYTYGEFMFNRSIVNRMRAEDNKDTLKGDGMEFQGNISIKIEKTIDADGKEVEKKKYSTYIRNCGNVEVPEKDEKFMKGISSGTRIRLYLIGSSCKISDWEKF